MWPKADDWDRDVLRAIAATGPDGSPLEDILERIDASQKLIVSREELNGALGRLVDAGLVRQVDADRFATSGPRHEPSRFRPISEAIYNAALANYHSAFGEAFGDLIHEFDDAEAPAWPKLSGEWQFGDRHYASELEIVGLSSVVEGLLHRLEAHGFVVRPGPLSIGPGTVDLSIYARKADNADQMLRIVLPVFVATAPPGSDLRVNEWDPQAVMDEYADPAIFERDRLPSGDNADEVRPSDQRPLE